MAVTPTPPPEDEGEEDGKANLREQDRPKPWNGDSNAICSGKTQKGQPCTSRARYSQKKLPYCAKHYPYSGGYLEYKKREANRSDEYCARNEAYEKDRARMLDEIAKLEQLARGLDDMNRTLQDTLRRLEIPLPEVAKPSMRGRATEVVRVDGLSVQLERASYPNARFWILGNDEEGMAALEQRNDRGWAVFERDMNTGEFKGTDWFLAYSREDAIRYSCLYSMCYRLRRKRELSWFRSEISALLQQGVDITSPIPLERLCGMTITKPGWHVFQRSGREEWNKFRCIYSGPSETEARWEYVNSGKDAEIATVLTSPLNQVVDHRVDTKHFM